MDGIVGIAGVGGFAERALGGGGAVKHRLVLVFPCRCRALVGAGLVEIAQRRIIRRGIIAGMAGDHDKGRDRVVEPDLKRLGRGVDLVLAEHALRVRRNRGQRGAILAGQVERHLAVHHS